MSTLLHTCKECGGKLNEKLTCDGCEGKRREEKLNVSESFVVGSNEASVNESRTSSVSSSQHSHLFVTEQNNPVNDPDIKKALEHKRNSSKSAQQIHREKSRKLKELVTKLHEIHNNTRRKEQEAENAWKKKGYSEVYNKLKHLISNHELMKKQRKDLQKQVKGLVDERAKYYRDFLLGFYAKYNQSKTEEDIETVIGYYCAPDSPERIVHLFSKLRATYRKNEDAVDDLNHEIIKQPLNEDGLEELLADLIALERSIAISSKLKDEVRREMYFPSQPDGVSHKWLMRLSFEGFYSAFGDIWLEEMNCAISCRVMVIPPKPDDNKEDIPPRCIILLQLHNPGKVLDINGNEIKQEVLKDANGNKIKRKITTYTRIQDFELNGKLLPMSYAAREVFLEADPTMHVEVEFFDQRSQKKPLGFWKIREKSFKTKIGQIKAKFRGAALFPPPNSVMELTTNALLAYGIRRMLLQVLPPELGLYLLNEYKKLSPKDENGNLTTWEALTFKSVMHSHSKVRSDVLDTRLERCASPLPENADNNFKSLLSKQKSVEFNEKVENVLDDDKIDDEITKEEEEELKMIDAEDDDDNSEPTPIIGRTKSNPLKSFFSSTKSTFTSFAASRTPGGVEANADNPTKALEVLNLTPKQARILIEAQRYLHIDYAFGRELRKSYKGNPLTKNKSVKTTKSGNINRNLSSTSTDSGNISLSSLTPSLSLNKFRVSTSSSTSNRSHNSDFDDEENDGDDDDILLPLPRKGKRYQCGINTIGILLRYFHRFFQPLSKAEKLVVLNAWQTAIDVAAINLYPEYLSKPKEEWLQVDVFLKNVEKIDRKPIRQEMKARLEVNGELRGLISVWKSIFIRVVSSSSSKWGGIEFRRPEHADSVLSPEEISNAFDTQEKALEEELSKEDIDLDELEEEDEDDDEEEDNVLESSKKPNAVLHFKSDIGQKRSNPFDREVEKTVIKTNEYYQMDSYITRKYLNNNNGKEEEEEENFEKLKNRNRSLSQMLKKVHSKKEAQYYIEEIAKKAHKKLDFITDHLVKRMDSCMDAVFAGGEFRMKNENMSMDAPINIQLPLNGQFITQCLQGPRENWPWRHEATAKQNSFQWIILPANELHENESGSAKKEIRINVSDCEGQLKLLSDGNNNSAPMHFTFLPDPKNKNGTSSNFIMKSSAPVAVMHTKIGLVETRGNLSTMRNYLADWLSWFGPQSAQLSQFIVEKLSKYDVERLQGTQSLRIQADALNRPPQIPFSISTLDEIRPAISMGMDISLIDLVEDFYATLDLIQLAD